MKSRTGIKKWDQKFYCIILSREEQMGLGEANKDDDGVDNGDNGDLPKKASQFNEITMAWIFNFNDPPWILSTSHLLATYV